MVPSILVTCKQEEKLGIHGLTNFVIHNQQVFHLCHLTAMWLWSFGTLTKVGRRLLNHIVTSLFMLTAKGSNPSCRPHIV